MEPFHNARLKRYPDGSAEVLIGSRPFGGGNVSRLPAYLDDGEPPFVHLAGRNETQSMRDERLYAELEQDAKLDEVRDQNAAITRAFAVSRAVRRARKAVRDLARSNDWAYFVTLTLSPERCNRYDDAEVLRHLRHWLGNNVRRKGLVYVIVPERHRDGAIHFHGFFNDALEAVDSGTVSVPGRKAPVKARSAAHKAALERMGGHTVYNLPGWGWGFSTAIKLYGEKEAAVNYVCKYIGKGLTVQEGSEVHVPEKIGGRWYYSGGALQRPAVEWFDVDVRDWEEMPGWHVPEEYPFCSFLRLRVTADGEVLGPYVEKDCNQTNVSRETLEFGVAVTEKGSSGTFVSRETVEPCGSVDAKHGRGSDHPAFAGGHESPGPSLGYDEADRVDSQARGSFASSENEQMSILTTNPHMHNSGNFYHLTFSGLSNGPAPPAPAPPQAPDPPE